VTDTVAAAQRACRSPVITWLARFGLVARGCVYVVLGWLALQTAWGHDRRQANSRGALADIAQHSFGIVVLSVLGVGFAAYALWRLSEAGFGTAADGKKLGPRLVALVGGVVYIALSAATFDLIAGRSKHSQAHQQVALTARVMHHRAGQWVVGVTGVVVVVIGLVMVAQGLGRKFNKDLRMDQLTGATRTVVVQLAMVGTIARGVVFAVAGALVVDAAVTFQPRKSTGLDGAVRTLANQRFGPWLLTAVALGVIAFGLYSVAAARWAKT
jgi:Domain of Unknown Function (DUF1206)